LREAKGLTQEELSKRCGISISFVSLLERGRRNPSYETLQRISEALQTSLADLFRSVASSGPDDDYYLRLVEFARQRRLSRSQVDRLMKVADVMFEGDAPKESTSRRSREAGSCVVENCHRPVLAKGLCVVHYHRARRARV